MSHRVPLLSLPQAAAEAEEEDTGRVTGKEGGANETAAKAKPAVVTTKETRSRKKTFRVALTIAGPGFAQPAMSPDQLKVSSFFLPSFFL